MTSKCYIIIREDLDMPVGKVAAQVGHAVDIIWSEFTVCGVSVRGANAANIEPKESDEKSLNDFSSWVQDGRRKIVLKIKSKEQLDNLYNKMKANGYSVSYINDNGFTHFEGVTCTGMVVYPCSTEVKELKRIRLW